MRRAESETAMAREFFRSIGAGSTGPVNIGSRLPKASADALPPVRKVLGKRVPADPKAKPVKK